MSFPYALYNATTIALQLLVQILIFVMTSLLVYDSQFIQTEMAYFAHRNREEDLIDMGKPEDLLASWKRHDKLKFFKRLRMPRSEEILSKR